MLCEMIKQVPRDKTDFLKVSLGIKIQPKQLWSGRPSQRNWGMFLTEILMVLCNRRNHAKVSCLPSSVYSPGPRQGGGGRESNDP